MEDKYELMTKFSLLWYFLVGCETYYISPTAWYYIKSLSQTKFFLALVLASFNITSVIAGPVFGFLTDRFGKPRFIFISCCVMKIIAYFIYSINLSAYFPLFGRLVSGIGNGAGYAVLLGQLVLQTGEEDRGRKLLFQESMYCVGSAFGPGIGSFVTFRLNIFGWEINDGNSPGIVLTIVWLLFLFVTFLVPNNVWVETGVRNQKSTSYSSEDETGARLGNNLENRNQKSAGFNSEKTKIKWDSRIFCLLFLIFTSEFFSSTSTFYVPVLAMDHFHLQIIHTKLLFLNCTIFTLMVFLIFHIASKYADERKLLVIALLMQITAILLLMSIAFSWDIMTSSQYYILLLYICIGMPYFAYPFGSSSLSKITHPRNASFIQGLAFAAVMLAIVSSRIVISFIFTKASLICYCFALATVWFVGFLWYIIVYKRLVPKV